MPDDDDRPLPLAYHGPGDGPRPASTVLIGASLLGGVGLGLVTVLMAGACIAALVAGTGEYSRLSGRALAALVAVGALAVVVASVAGAVRQARAGASLTLERRRSPSRFVVIGFLIGCCLASLLAGLCFGGLAVSG